MNTGADIEQYDDIKLLVDSFYANVQKDELIGGIFMGAINNWPHHLEKMYRFWQTVLLEQHTYNGSPFPPHAQLPVGPAHFERWLQLFKTTIDEHFTGPKAEEALWRAGKMAAIFQHKIAYIQAQGGTSPTYMNKPFISRYRLGFIRLVGHDCCYQLLGSMVEISGTRYHFAFRTGNWEIGICRVE